jgi:hypothetical protein
MSHLLVTYCDRPREYYASVLPRSSVKNPAEMDTLLLYCTVERDY